jgi:hypothetical protein
VRSTVDQERPTEKNKEEEEEEEEDRLAAKRRLAAKAAKRNKWRRSIAMRALSNGN